MRHVVSNLSRMSSPTRTIQHYKSFEFGFVGIRIDPRIEDSQEPTAINARTLGDLFFDLLQLQPELQGCSLSAKEWATHLVGVIDKDDPEKKTLFTAKYISWILMAYEPTFKLSLGMLTAKNGHTGIKDFSFILPKPTIAI